MAAGARRTREVGVRRAAPPGHPLMCPPPASAAKAARWWGGVGCSRLPGGVVMGAPCTQPTCSTSASCCLRDASSALRSSTLRRHVALAAWG